MEEKTKESISKTNPLWFMGIETPRPQGYYSETIRDFHDEMIGEEIDHSTPIDYFLTDDPDSIYNDPDFHEEVKELWEKYMKGAKEDFTQHSKIHFIGQSHIDIAWKWRLGQSIKKVQCTFGKALKQIDLFPEYSFSASQPALFEMLEKSDPAMFENLKKKVEGGRFELVGACWTEPDPRMPSGEAFVRQHLYGQRYFLRHFGKISEIAWFQDSFGYSVQMPQLSVRSGCKYFFTNKISSNKETIFPTCQFHWHSPDGSSLLSYWVPNGFKLFMVWSRFKHTYRLLKPGIDLHWSYQDDQPENMDVWSDEIPAQIGIFYGLGDGGHGPTGEEFAQVRLFKDWGNNVCSSTALDYYHELEKYSDRLSHFHDELYYEFHRATLSTHHLVKYMNRRMEWNLQGLENIASFLSLNPSYSYRYPYERFTRLWKNVCTLHMHDILPGSSVPEVYDDCWDAWQLFNRWQSVMYDDICTALNMQKGSDAILIINPLLIAQNTIIQVPWTESLPIPIALEDQNGNTITCDILDADPSELEVLEQKPRRLVFSLSLNPLEIETLKVIPSESSSSNYKKNLSEKISVTVTETEYLLENPFYRLRVDKSTGQFLSLIIKGQAEKSGSEIETLAGTSNLTQIFGDWLLSEPAWNFNPTYRDYPFEEDELVVQSVELLPSSQLSCGLKITLSAESEELGTASIIQTVRLYADLEGIDLETYTDWHLHEASMKLFFSVAGNPQESISEVAYGIIRRSLYPAANHDVPRWENNMLNFLSIPAEDGSFCFNILNEGKYGYDNIEGNKIGITMIRGPRYPEPPPSSWISRERSNREKITGDFPPTNTDQGGHIIRLRLLPRFGSWDEQNISPFAQAFNRPPLGIPISSASLHLNSSPMISTSQGIVASSLKIMEQGNEINEDWKFQSGLLTSNSYVLRVYEAIGVEQKAEITLLSSLNIRDIACANLLEQETSDSSLEIGKDELGNVTHIRSNFKPNEIKTFLLSF